MSEVVLVHDSGPDRSDLAIRALAERYGYVRPVWLARNFGQHAATLAGMASTSADWIVTMDEDGQHDPAAIGALLDVALARPSPLVYARPTNTAPHGAFRERHELVAHGIAGLLGAGGLRHFHSFRLVLGEVGRGLAAYCGESVYLDVALTWVVSRTAVCPVRDARGARAPVRLLGAAPRVAFLASRADLRDAAAAAGRDVRRAAQPGRAVVLAGAGSWRTVAREVPVQGWTSVMVVLLVPAGGTLFSLGIVAEYLGIAAETRDGQAALPRGERSGRRAARGVRWCSAEAASASPAGPVDVIEPAPRAPLVLGHRAAGSSGGQVA